MLEKKLTRGERVNADISALLRARNTLLWIVTREEKRVESAIIDAAAGSAKYDVRFWDCATGLSDMAYKPLEVTPDMKDPNGILNKIRETPKRSVYVLRDFHKWLADPFVLRNMRSLARDLQNEARESGRAIVVLSPSAEIPPELSGSAILIDYPLPDRVEIKRVLDDTLSNDKIPEEMRKLSPAVYEAAIDAAVGLTTEEAGNCYARSLIVSRTIDPVLVSGEKKRVIAKEKVLTWYDPDPRGLAAVGGLGALKSWLVKRESAFSPAAREYGLPAPKGALFAGLPGTGKSLLAKCIASAWKMPLLKLDMGALRSKYVGDSEANIRKALAVADAVSPCIVWIDEIEKALGGSSGPQGDGGVSADALGTLLSWMQDHQGSCFVVATANDVRSLPPELLRKGRFDEIFWVDLPNASERKEIFAAAMSQNKRNAKGVDVDAVVEATTGFVGSEIAAIVPEAMFTAFADGAREVTTEDLVAAAATVVPLSKTSEKKVTDLREWGKSNARSASTPEAVSNVKRSARDLDV